MPDYNHQNFAKMFSDCRQDGSNIQIQEYFSRVQDGSKDSYFKLFSGQSIIRVSINRKTEEQNNIAFGNIKVMDLMRVIKKTEALSEKYMFFSPQSKESVQSVQASSAAQPAQDVKFTMGNLRGKTPQQCLAEGVSKEELEKQKQFLLANVSKYPKNQQIIDAIDAALADGAQNTDATAAPAATEAVILHGGLEPKDFRTLKDRRGDKTLVYALQIIADVPSDQVIIEIINAYCLIEKRGAFNVIKMSTMEGRTANRWILSWKVWEDLAQVMRWDIEQCVSEWHEDCRRKAIGGREDH